MFLVLILALFGIAGAYQTILHSEIYEDTESYFSFTNTFSLVAEQAIGGFTRLPNDVNGTVIVWFACLFVTIMLLNSLIAILSDAWVEVKENF